MSQFLNLEILNRIANGNVQSYKQDEIDKAEEIEIFYCSACGFRLNGKYEQEIGTHVECKGE